MAKLVPSILENSKDKFLETYSKEIKLPGVERIQVDFGDGVFVPNKILPISDIDGLNPAVIWEAHLMIESPNDFLDYQIAGFNCIIVHYEAYENVAEVKKALNSIKSLGLQSGLCLKKDTPVEVVEDFLNITNYIQLMSVDPGFQGTPFFELTYERLKTLRKLAPDAIIEVDGGINVGNVKKVADAGADFIILGAAITKVPDMEEAFRNIEEKLNTI